MMTSKASSAEWRTRWKRTQPAKESALPRLDHLTANDFQNVYEPSDDTYLFVDVIRSLGKILREEVFTDERALCCVEIGSGSGTLSATLLSELKPLCSFSIATDCNLLACEATSSTMVENGFMGRADSINCDLVSVVQPNSFDILLFNPPYVPTADDEVGGVDITAAWAGGYKGRQVLDRLFPMLEDCLRKKSLLLILAVEENDPDDIARILEGDHGYTCYCVGARKAFNERLLVILAIRGVDLESSFPSEDQETKL